MQTGGVRGAKKKKKTISVASDLYIASKIQRDVLVGLTPPFWPRFPPDEAQHPKRLFRRGVFKPK